MNKTILRHMGQLLLYVWLTCNIKKHTNYPLSKKVTRKGKENRRAAQGEVLKLSSEWGWVSTKLREVAGPHE